MSTNVVIKIHGGLGNQLFQYALGRSLEINCGADVSFYISDIARKNGRHFMLDLFHTNIEIANFFPKTVLDRLLIALKGKNYAREKSMLFTPSLLQHIKNGGVFYLDGYWQTEKYFQNIREQLLSEIVLKNHYSERAAELSQSISSSASVAIHVRRDDYVTNKINAKVHGVCSADYYHGAIEIIRKKISNPHFFIFSDEVEWAKQNLGLATSTISYVSGNGLRDEEEFMLMSECKHIITANSSFSWWAAWLNRNKQKIVIAPERWFADPSKNAPTIIPTEWVKL